MARHTLEQLRTFRGLTQVELAKTLGINQSALSKLERRPDMYLSTLRAFVQAIGGRLEVRAVFPDAEAIDIAGLDRSGILSDVRDLLWKRCQIQPMPPDHEFNDFLLKAIDENNATFEKLSNNQELYVPVRRIAEVLPETPSRLPIVQLKGSLQWSANKRLWQFAP